MGYGFNRDITVSSVLKGQCKYSSLECVRRDLKVQHCVHYWISTDFNKRTLSSFSRLTVYKIQSSQTWTFWCTYLRLINLMFVDLHPDWFNRIQQNNWRMNQNVFAWGWIITYYHWMQNALFPSTLRSRNLLSYTWHAPSMHLAHTLLKSCLILQAPEQYYPSILITY